MEPVLETIIYRSGSDLEENNLESQDCATDCSGDLDLAVQSEKDDADINEIMKRFGRTGNLPTPHEIPYYGDFSDVTDYQTALNDLKHAQNAFQGLPSGLRTRFNNDPAELLNFIHNDANYDEAAKLGLVPRKEIPPVNPPTKTE